MTQEKPFKNMMIPHLQDLDREKLKQPEISFEMLLAELKEQCVAKGVCSEKARREEGNKNFNKWLQIRQCETAEISIAVQAEILRRFSALEEGLKEYHRTVTELTADFPH